MNISNSAELCQGSPQVVPAFMYTLLPNFFIFGTLLLLLSVFPGWRAPFSNTIGYIVVDYFMKVSNDFNDLLVSKGSKLIEKICSDKSLIINEITPTNYDSFFQKMSKDKLLVSNYKSHPAYNHIWKCLAVKDSIADCIWYLLTGVLVITTTYNSLLDIKCAYSDSENTANEAEFAEQQQKLLEKQKKNEVLYTHKS